MNTKQPASICILLLSILFLNGCSESANESANLPTQPEATIASDDHPPSDVELTLPDIESSTTLALRAEGKFNPAAHDFGNPFEFEFQGRMHYRIRLTCKFRWLQVKTNSWFAQIHWPTLRMKPIQRSTSRTTRPSSTRRAGSLVAAINRQASNRRSVRCNSGAW